MFNMKSKSLQTKIMALNGAVVLSIAACISFTTWQFNQYTQEKSMESLEALAASANSAIQAQFFERYGDVQAFATNPKVRDRSKAEIVNALDTYVALYGIYDLIIVADLNGRIVGVNSKDPAGKKINSDQLYGRSVADTEWFKNTVAGRTSDDKTNNFAGTFVEDIHLDSFVNEVYGEKRPGNSFSSLIRDEKGQPIGVISNRAGSRWLEAELLNVAAAASDQDFVGASVTVLNGKGVVLAEVNPAGNGKFDVLRDFGKLMLFNYVENGSPFAIALQKDRKAGHMVAYSPIQKSDFAAGFSPVTGSKWVNSIIWGVMVRDSAEELFAPVNAMIRNICLILGFLFLAALAAGYFFSRGLAGTLRAMAQGLSDNSKEVSQVSTKLAESSNLLSSSATEQAAALQETVASIDEVSAMVSKNADNARRSQEISSGSADTAQKGKVAVTDMIKSIDEINESNQEIVNQVEEGNRQISEIVKVITEIGNKTKVINDIVFQTKLLSFNASVEAARAGEHGKGFAVVAEEVGNLAQMSGNAAKEISQMLDTSIAKVDTIVSETKSRVERLTTLSKEKVQAGTVTARRCGEVLDEIVKSVGEVNVMVSEIATASKEQAQGVAEINKAMNQLDQVTQSNASSSQDAAAGADRLRNQSVRLGQIIEQLSHAVEGGEAAASANFIIAEAEPKSGVEGKKGTVMQFPKKSAGPKTSYKAAVGAENPPSHDDSRFEEV